MESNSTDATVARPVDTDDEIATPEAAFITGASLTIDGGFTA